jgi:hypothetical protein
MPKKMYTDAYSVTRDSGTPESQLNSEEHASLTEATFAAHFTSRDALLRWYLSENNAKLTSLAFIIQEFYSSGANNILSLGAGPGVLEYLLKCALPENTRVIAADFDAFFVKKSQEFFPEILAVKFDFFDPDVERLKAKIGTDIDFVVFWGSAYVMDDGQFVRLFSRLRDAGVSTIVDFEVGYMGWKTRLTQSGIAIAMKRSGAVSRFLGRSRLGTFHGYSRTQHELRELYRRSGFKRAREAVVSPYKYVAILQR